MQPCQSKWVDDDERQQEKMCRAQTKSKRKTHKIQMVAPLSMTTSNCALMFYTLICFVLVFLFFVAANLFPVCLLTAFLFALRLTNKMTCHFFFISFFLSLSLAEQSENCWVNTPKQQWYGRCFSNRLTHCLILYENLTCSVCSCKFLVASTVAN